MTDRIEKLLARLAKEIEALPEAEQEEIGEELLDTLRRRTRERGEDETTPHLSLAVLQNAQIEGLPPDYSERLDYYLYGAGNE